MNKRTLKKYLIRYGNYFAFHGRLMCLVSHRSLRIFLHYTKIRIKFRRILMFVFSYIKMLMSRPLHAYYYSLISTSAKESLVDGCGMKFFTTSLAPTSGVE